MRRTWIIAIPLLAALVLLVGMGVGACGGGVGEQAAPPPEEVTPPPEEEEELTPMVEEEETPPAPGLPKPGEWVASTGCDEFTFTFTVSPDGTGITEITYSLFAFECAGWVQTVVPSTVEESPPWPITGGQFTIEAFKSPPENLPGIEREIVIQGSFDETGMHASGTWEISVEGTACSPGTWEASR